MTLTVIWLLPLVGSAIVAFLPPRFAKWLGVVVALVALGVTAYVASSFQAGFHGATLAFPRASGRMLRDN